MLYNARQSYTPALELSEFDDRSLIIDSDALRAFIPRAFPQPSRPTAELGRVIRHDVR